MISHSELLLNKMKKHRWAGDVNKIRTLALEASKIIRRLRSPSGQKYGPKKWIYMNDLIKEVLEITRPSLQEKFLKKKVSFHLNLGQTPKIFGEALALKEVLINIILNAMDALLVKKEKRRSISVRTLYHRKALKIIISDSGIGIPKAIRKKVMKPFFTTKKSRGTGLGLSSARQIIKTHGGTLKVISRYGIGTTFILSFPVTLNEKSQNIRKKIMLVDDEKDFRRTTAKLLMLEGYDVTEASRAQEALQKLRNHPVDIVLSDMKMPRISGVDLAKKIKELNCDTKIIMISGDRGSSVKNPYINGWLTKPCEVSVIHKMIQRI